MNQSEGGYEIGYDYWSKCLYIIQGTCSIRYQVSYAAIWLSITLWEFTLGNNRSWCKDLSKVNNSVEYKKEEYIDATG